MHINRMLIKIYVKRKMKALRVLLAHFLLVIFTFLLCIISESISNCHSTMNTKYWLLSTRTCLTFRQRNKKKKMNNFPSFFYDPFNLREHAANVKKLLLLKLETTSLYSNLFTLKMASARSPMCRGIGFTIYVWTRAFTEHMHMPIGMPIHQCILLNEIQ